MVTGPVPAGTSCSEPGRWGPAPALSPPGHRAGSPAQARLPVGQLQGDTWQLSGKLCGLPQGLGLSEPQFPQLEGGQPAHVACKGGAGEGRRGRQELSGHRPPCDVTARVHPAVPCPRRTSQPGAAASLGAATRSWRESHPDLVLAPGSMWPVEGPNRKVNQQSAGTQSACGGLPGSGGL